MKKDVWAYCRGCVPYQKAKPSNKPHTGLMQQTAPEVLWTVVGLDLIGPLPKTPKCHDNFLVMADYFQNGSYWFHCEQQS